MGQIVRYVAWIGALHYAQQWGSDMARFLVAMLGVWLGLHGAYQMARAFLVRSL